jgi:hypothetical protein
MKINKSFWRLILAPYLKPVFLNRGSSEPYGSAGMLQGFRGLDQCQLILGLLETAINILLIWDANNQWNDTSHV